MPLAENSTEDRPVPKVRWQFGLRSLLILMTATAVVLAIRQPAVRKYQRQMELTQRWREHGAIVQLDPIEPAPLRWIVANDSLRRVTEVQLIYRSPPEERLESLAELPELERLYLPRTGLTDDDLEHVAGLTKLKRLALWKNKITDEGISHLQGLENLEILDIHDTRVTEAALVHLESLPRFRRLITTMTLTDEGLATLARCPHHPRLIRDAAKVDGITDQGMADLAAMRLIKRLDISNSKVSPRGYAWLQRMTKLDTLSITTEVPCDDSLMFHLQRMPALNKIHVSGPTRVTLGRITRQWGEQMRKIELDITPRQKNVSCSVEGLGQIDIELATADMDSLAHCRNVVRMSVHSSELNEPIIAGIGHLKNLTYLAFIPADREHGVPDMTNAAQHLGNLSQLVSLHVCWALTDEQLTFLADLPSLETFTLHSMPITGAGFAEISERSRLRHVEIWDCPHFNDEGVAHLLTLKNLRSIRLSDLNISGEAKASVVRKLGLKNVKFH